MAMAKSRLVVQLLPKPEVLDSNLFGTSFVIEHHSTKCNLENAKIKEKEAKTN